MLDKVKKTKTEAEAVFNPLTASREELAKFIGDKVHESIQQVLEDADAEAGVLDIITGRDFTAEDLMRDAIKHAPVLGGDGGPSDLT